MSLVSGLRAAASGLTAQRLRMDVIANNVANANTTRTAEGGAYRREQVVLTPRTRQVPFSGLLSRSGGQAVSSPISAASKETGGVEVTAIVEDPTPPRLVYEPGHPDANEDGFVEYPNVDLVREMTDMMAATRAYEANVTVFNAIKGMALKTLEMGR